MLIIFAIDIDAMLFAIDAFFADYFAAIDVITLMLSPDADAAYYAITLADDAAADDAAITLPFHY